MVKADGQNHPMALHGVGMGVFALNIFNPVLFYTLFSQLWVPVHSFSIPLIMAVFGGVFGFFH